jgi:hypothetical protein
LSQGLSWVGETGRPLDGLFCFRTDFLNELMGHPIPCTCIFCGRR